jgi:hypothetical protein
MKKLAFTIIALLLFVYGAQAQSLAIKEFRQIIAARDSQFKPLQKTLLREIPEDGMQIYASTIEDSPISKALIVQTKDKVGTYMISYNVDNMEIETMGLFMQLVEQYVLELNAMAKTGNYKGRDYNDNGDSITELTDMDGNVVAQYVSNKSNHLIMVYGK